MGIENRAICRAIGLKFVGCSATMCVENANYRGLNSVKQP